MLVSSPPAARRRVLKSLSPKEAKARQLSRMADSPIGSARDCDVSADEATVWLREKNYPFQRKIIKSNVIRLQREMEIGRFRSGTQIFIAVLPDGREWILNGYHTLTAIAEGGFTQRLSVFHKPIADEGEAAIIYSTFDDMKKRTIRDVIRAHGSPVPEKISSIVGGAMRVIMLDFYHKSTERFQKEGLMEVMTGEFWDGVHIYSEILESTKGEARRFLGLSAVGAVAIYTLKYQREKAYEFWVSVVRDDGLTQGQPEKALLTYLRNLKGVNDSRKSVCYATALAWNKFYKGISVEHLRAGSLTYFRIAGTPLERGL
jgi:hypothetical protein